MIHPIGGVFIRHYKHDPNTPDEPIGNYTYELLGIGREVVGFTDVVMLGPHPKLPIKTLYSLMDGFHTDTEGWVVIFYPSAIQMPMELRSSEKSSIEVGVKMKVTNDREKYFAVYRPLYDHSVLNGRGNAAFVRPLSQLFQMTPDSRRPGEGHLVQRFTVIQDQALRDRLTELRDRRYALPEPSK